jgi:hypothetical protein
MKTCSKCKQELPLSCFAIQNRRGKSDHQAYCRTCNSTLRAAWGRENPKHIRKNAVWVKYRLREQDYKALMQKQNSACAICQADFGQATIHIDHCHTTNKVRGLLCQPCNLSLGHVEKMAKYAERVCDYLGWNSSP